MQLTPQQREIGRENYNEAVAFTRRNFLVGAAAAVPSLGAAYFGYEKLKGNRVKVGFIGTGDEGSVLLTQHPEDYMEIVAVADIRPTNLKRAKMGDGPGKEDRIGLINKLGAETAMKIKEYADHRELLNDPEIEAVVIAVPLNQHAPLAMEALEAGKHVLTEKLMAHNVRQCKQMIQKAREKKLLLAVGHQRHYSVLYDNANDLVQKGLLGDIKYIRAQWHRNNSFPGRDSWRKGIAPQDQAALADKVKEFGFDSVEQLVNWRLYNKTGGGLMAELGSHQLDACSIFLGKVKPISVLGYGGRNFYGVKDVGSKDKQADDREIDDQVFVTFEFPGQHYHPESNPNDIVVVTYSSISTNRQEPYGETIFGSRGTMIVEEEQKVMLYKEEAPLKPGGLEQRLYVIQGQEGKPVLSASESLSRPQAVSATVSGKVSRGYTEEMEHFCHCIREGIFEKPENGGLRCPGEQGMKDAIMALTSNLAMKHKKRIVFKDEWFDPDNLDAVPEEDEQVKG